MDDRFSESPRERCADHKDDHNEEKSSKRVPKKRPDAPSSSREQTVVRSVRRSDLGRIADLVACGDLPFPADLPADQLVQLADMVREHRRRRLVRFIARLIARSIRDEFKHHSGGKTDA